MAQGVTRCVKKSHHSIDLIVAAWLASLPTRRPSHQRALAHFLFSKLNKAIKAQHDTYICDLMGGTSSKDGRGRGSPGIASVVPGLFFFTTPPHPQRQSASGPFGMALGNTSSVDQVLDHHLTSIHYLGKTHRCRYSHRE